MNSSWCHPLMHKKHFTVAHKAFYLTIKLLPKRSISLSPSTASVPLELVYGTAALGRQCTIAPGIETALLSHSQSASSYICSRPLLHSKLAHKCIVWKTKGFAADSVRAEMFEANSRMQLNIMRVVVGCAQLTSCSAQWERRSARPWFMADSAGDAAGATNSHTPHVLWSTSTPCKWNTASNNSSSMHL
jgi:hypothetical protein